MDPDALFHPVGPLPPGTYWVRRALVVAALVVAVLLLARGAASLGGGSAAQRVGGRQGGPTPVTETTPTSTRSTVASPSPPTEPRASPSPRAPQPCPDRLLSVSAGTDAVSYPAGVRPVLTLTVRNVGPVACIRDLGPRAWGLRVLSGADRIWSSDDCERPGTALTMLARGASRSFALPWPRVRSRPGCPTPGPAALPGTYRLYAELGRITSAPAVFTLR